MAGEDSNIPMWSDTTSFVNDCYVLRDAAWFKMYEPLRLRYERLKIRGNVPFNWNSEPLVTVCIPTYNRAELLVDRALKSVCGQTYTNLEVIVVGDCCTDDTALKIRQLNDSRIRFLNLKARNKSYPDTVENHWLVGGANPCNEAFKLVTGDWVARIDDDDIWTEDHIEKLLKFATTGDYEFVSAAYIEERFGERSIVRGVPVNDKYFTQKENSLEKPGPKIGGVSTWLFRSYLTFMRHNLNCWRKSWNRVWDIDLSLRIYASGARIGYFDDVVSYILPRPGENSVGLSAYQIDAESKAKHYALSKRGKEF